MQPFPIERAELAGEVSIIYRLDKSRVTQEQLEQLAAGAAQHFSLPFEEVLAEMKKGIVPIKAEDVVTTGCQIHVLGAIL